MKQQIISIGGGGFSNWGKYSDKDREISQYFLKQTGKENPSIAFYRQQALITLSISSTSTQSLQNCNADLLTFLFLPLALLI